MSTNSEIMKQLDRCATKERRILEELAATKPGPHRRDLLTALVKVQKQAARLRKQAVRCQPEQSEVRS